MLDQDKIEEFIQQITAMMPNDLSQTRQDLKKNLKATLTAIFTRMDLVTQEEFNIQTELLVKTQELVVQLEKKVTKLETERNELVKEKAIRTL